MKKDSTRLELRLTAKERANIEKLTKKLKLRSMTRAIVASVDHLLETIKYEKRT